MRIQLFPIYPIQKDAKLRSDGHICYVLLPKSWAGLRVAVVPLGPSESREPAPVVS